jgi:hypothetical protein
MRDRAKRLVPKALVVMTAGVVLTGCPSSSASYDGSLDACAIEPSDDGGVQAYLCPLPNGCTQVTYVDGYVVPVPMC